MTPIELNEWGMLVFKHKTNKNLFIQKSYRWKDVAHMIDESQGRLIIDSFTFSTYDLTDWDPMTLEEYNKVKSNFNEIYNQKTDNMDRILINGEWYVKESILSNVETKNDLPDISNMIYNYNVISYENDDIALEAHFSDNKSSEHETPLIVFLDKKQFGLNLNKQEYWDSILWMKGVYENNPESTETINPNYLPVIRSFINHMVNQNILDFNSKDNE